MSSPFVYLSVGAWLAWLAYWGWTGRKVKPAQRVESHFSRFVKYFLPIIVAVLLMQPLVWFIGTPLGVRFVPPLFWIAVVGLVLIYAGLLFACWARYTLGRNWSGVVQLKEDHELIVRGPYRFVRHPIYTGLLLAMLGSAVLVGEWRALLGMAIMFVSFWRKLRVEERWLTELFGAAYVDYMRRVKALIPGVL